MTALDEGPAHPNISLTYNGRDMADSASEATRKHFAEEYSAKTEDELRTLADDAWTLAKPAKDALRTEFSRREVGDRIA